MYLPLRSPVVQHFLRSLDGIPDEVVTIDGRWGSADHFPQLGTA